MHPDLKEYSTVFKGDFSRTELCHYLNNDFAQAAFTDEEAALLLPFEPFGKVFLISREEMASILWRYAAWRGFDTSATASLSSFGDGNRVSNYASAPMSWAVTNGYIAGFPDGTLCPREGATRAQVASVLRRFRAAHEGDYVGDPAESQNE